MPRFLFKKWAAYLGFGIILGVTAAFGFAVTLFIGAVIAMIALYQAILPKHEGRDAKAG